MQRVLVIGSGGAGKSTLARQLGERLGLPVIHLDAHYWQAGWTETPTDEWTAQVARLIGDEAWVMDGNYSGTLDLRIPAADTIVFLDLPRIVCLWRVLRRRLAFHGRARPDVRPGCPERISWEFIDWIWNYRARQRPRVLARLRAVAGEKRVFVLRSSREVKGFIQGLGAESDQGN
jgi:adenylate kinase family enzyme